MHSLQLRGTGYPGQQVAGESHYYQALRTLTGRQRTGERELTAALRREPTNRHDANAIQVLIDGQLVGHLPREDAARYQPSLQMVEGRGQLATCAARLWWSKEDGDFIASVSLDLAEPAELIHVNSPTSNGQHVVLPAGRSYQVSGTAEHLDVLAPLIARAYVPGSVAMYGTLRATARKGTRTTSHIVTVHIDNQEIGELSKQTSTKMLPLVQRLQDARIDCYVDVLLTGNSFAVTATVATLPPEKLPAELVQQLEQMLS